VKSYQPSPPRSKRVSPQLPSCYDRRGQIRLRPGAESGVVPIRSERPDRPHPADHNKSAARPGTRNAPADAPPKRNAYARRSGAAGYPCRNTPDSSPARLYHPAPAWCRPARGRARGWAGGAFSLRRAPRGRLSRAARGIPPPTRPRPALSFVERARTPRPHPNAGRARHFAKQARPPAAGRRRTAALPIIKSHHHAFP